MNLALLILAVSLTGQLQAPSGTSGPLGNRESPKVRRDPARPIELDLDSPLTGQNSPARPPAGTGQPPATTSAPPDDTSATSPRALARSTQVLEDAMALPASAMPQSEPITLLAALEGTTQLRQRVDVTHAYWNTSAAMAQLRYSRQESEQLNRLPPVPSSNRALAAALAAQRANAAATVREAEVALTSAQNDLAERLGRSATAALPHPTDLPHVQTYETRFDDLFAGQTAPLGLRMLGRSLPLRHAAIAARAAAVLAANDAMEAAQAARPADLSIILGCQAELIKQRRAFITAVRAYNHDIAVYALNAAGNRASGKELVGMLIELPVQPVRADGEPTSAGRSPDNSRLEHARYDEEIPNEAGSQDGPALSAPDRDARSVDEDTPSADGEADADPQQTWRPSRRGAWRTYPRRTGGQRFQQAAYWYQPLAAPTAADTRMLGALESLPPARRAQELAGLLHSGAVSPGDDASPATLSECLSAISDIDRRPLVAAYWQACESAAQRNVLEQYAAELDALSQVAVDQIAANEGERPELADAMLRLEARRLAAHSDLADAQLAHFNAAVKLTQLVRKGTSETIVQPVTQPHAGRYLLKLSAQPASVQRTPLVRKLAKTVPSLQLAVDDRATAVVHADAAHARVAGDFVAGQASLDAALRAGLRQHEATQAFLASVTRYNLEIAHYVLTVLPPETPAATIGGALSLAKANR